MMPLEEPQNKQQTPKEMNKMNIFFFIQKNGSVEVKWNAREYRQTTQ